MQDAEPRHGTPAFLALWNDFDPGRDEEYNRWHTFEHVPERLGVEGILSGMRYWAPEREQLRYFTLYELGSIAVLGGADYTRLVRRPSEWSARMRPSFRGFVRQACTQVADAGAGLGGAIAAFRFRAPHELDRIQSAPVLQSFLETGGITRLRLGHAEPSAPYPIASAAPETAGGEAYVLIAEGLERAALERRAPRIAESLRADLEADRTIAWETYLLAFAMRA
jgi:hypothetical protein